MFNQKQLMNQLKKMHESVLRVQEELKIERVEGASGDGKVRALVNGHMEIQSVKIDSSLLVPDDAEILEDLIVLAVQDAAEKARQLSMQRLGPLAGGMQIPGLI